MPRPPGVSFLPPTISLPGSGHWLRAACSTPPTNAAGSTASSPRTRASPRAKSTGTASPKLAGGTEHDLFSRRRDPRLQLENQLRSNQPDDAHRVDQSSRIAGRTADSQYPLGESARSDLQSVTAAAAAVADRHPLGRISH